MSNIKDILNSAISILKTIRINYNSPIGPRTTALVAEVSRLIPLLENDQPCIAECLKQSLANISFNGLINAYSFGDIRTALKILANIYIETNENKLSNRYGKKIFISHSSKDIQIVSDFVDHILCLGIGINRNDNFCTSIEDVAIRNGEDIRKHIQDNIRCADYSFLLISDNYKASEICLNEMGAVWAYDSNVRLYLLPDTNFNSIGWLCDTRKANKITDTVALDLLYKEMCEYYSLPDNFRNWSQQRVIFINR